MNIEKFYNEKFHNKRVALIGPSDYVNKELDEEHGNYIDSFDTVCKLSSMINLPKNLEKYYGKRLDLLLSSFWHRNNDYDYIKNKNEKMCIPQYLFKENFMKHKDTTYIGLNMNDKLKNICEKVLKDESKNFKCYMNDDTIDFKNKDFLNKILGKKYYSENKNPTTGLLSLANILRYEPKELYISGITFYAKTDYNFYYDFYLRNYLENYTCKDAVEKLYTHTGTYGIGPVKTLLGVNERESDDHNYSNERIIFKKLLKNKNVKVDTYLQKIFSS